MARSFTALSSVDPGFEAEGRLTFGVALPRAEYPDAGSARVFYRAVTERLAGLPRVEQVGLSGSLPLTGSKNAGPVEAVDDPVPEGELGPMVDRGQAGPGYFRAMGISLLEGRTFTDDDGADGYPAVVVSASLARRLWPGESAVGKWLGLQDGELDWEVVGVVEDVHHESLSGGPTPYLYQPLVFGAPEDLATSRGLSMTLLVSGGDPLSVLPAVRAAMREVDPRLPLVRPRAMAAVVSDAMSATSFTVLLLGIAAAIALLLGSVGIYGVISYMVSHRTREIGVRMALGAPAASVRRGVVGEGMALAGLGLVLGLAASWALSRVLASLLYGVSTTDPLTYAGTTAGLAALAFVAAWVPARRASRVDPVQALRAD